MSQKNDDRPLGVLLANLGTPLAPTPKAVRRFLAQFLADPRVVELPRWLWLPILYGVILPFRPFRSAKLYKKIWRPQGSPLLHISQLQAQGLQVLLTERCAGPVYVELGMRYGLPSIADGLENLRRKQVAKIIILPMYPQYSATTTGSTFDAVMAVIKKWRWVPELHFLDHYAEHLPYIAAIAASIEAHWQQHSRAEKLLFSFHGLPKRFVDLGDPYYDLCHKTAQLVAEKLGLDKNAWQLVFQSRFGRQEWLQPYCDKTLTALAKHGVHSVEVVCPGFSADCLETLEEMAITNRELFLEAGGQEFHYIPALNDQPQHLHALADLICANNLSLKTGEKNENC